MYSQIKAPNLGVVGVPGECLVYSREIFNVPAKYPTATSAWANATYKHPGQLPPTNVSTPVWFSLTSTPDGHVAVSVPGKGIYSTTAQGDKIFPSIQALMNYMGSGIEYLGWSEDIDGERVVEVVATPAPTTNPTPGTINLPVTSGSWHLYKPGGPYNPNVAADVIAVVHPSLYAPGGLTYPVKAYLGNGVYRIQSPSHGLADLWTNGSHFVLK